ncbi:MAG: hypothetical protein ABIX46_14960 [Burkholderiaceae bacterium]
MAASGASGIEPAEAGRIERLLDAPREALAQPRRNLDVAQRATERVAAIQAGAQRVPMPILPVVRVPIASVSGLLYFKLRI